MSAHSAKEYVNDHKIPQLFESLMAGLMYHRPEKPIQFLKDCMAKLDDTEQPEYPWNLFTGKKRRNKQPSRVPTAAGDRMVVSEEAEPAAEEEAAAKAEPAADAVEDSAPAAAPPAASEAEAKAPASEDNDVVAKIAAIKESHPENRMAKHFDADYYNSLEGELKAAFVTCLNSGIMNPDSSMGCYAMQPADYDRFKPFFAKVLADYHGVAEDAKHTNNWDLSGVEGLPEDGKLDLAALGLPALSMRVRVGRNLADFPLPGAMTQEDRVSLEKKMCEAFDKLKSMEEYGGKYNSLTPEHPDFIDEEEYKKLVAEHIMFKDMSVDPYLVNAGIAKDWPYGRGCYVSEDRGFVIWVGEEDHLRIMCMKKGTMLNEVFDRLKTALDVVNGIEGLSFAMSADYGCVTSCPTNLGTGMRASVHIGLPNLTADGTDAKAKEVCKPLGLSVRGIGGEHTPIGEGGVCDISPRARFCISEAEIITALYNGIKALKAKEDEAAAGAGASAGEEAEAAPAEAAEASEEGATADAE